jgi:hypothetical protein
MGGGRKLTDDERTILTALVKAARAGEPCPTNEDLLGLLPQRNSLSGIIKIMDRLADRKIIRIDRYQRSRRVTIVASGKATAKPSNTATHWRNRPRNIPSPAIASVQQRKPDAAAEIIRQAQTLGLAPQDFLCDLVWIGWQTFRDSATGEPGVRRIA